MKKNADILIHWLDESKSSLALNKPYYVITGSDGKTIRDEYCWSLVIHITEHHFENNNMTSLASAYFLVPEAPNRLLTEGNELYIYEGRKHIGIVEVISVE